MSSWYRQQLENWLKGLDVKADLVYDLGGAQLPVRGRTKSWDVDRYSIIDLENPHQIKQNPNILFNAEVGDWDENRELPLADVVFCLEMMEYVIEPVVVMENIYKMLKENGTAYITFPFVYPIHNPVGADSLRYTINGIHRLTEATDLTIKQVTHRRDNTGYLEKVYLKGGMRAAPNFQLDVTGYIVEVTK